ncbi:MAG: hypothetical protein R2860_12580 [Desulfobacterales bacterium]
MLRLIRELLEFQPENRSSINAGIEYLGRVITKRSVWQNCFWCLIFLEQGYEKQLTVLSKKHDLIAVSITDPREIALPDVGLIELEDAETGELILIDTGSRKIRQNYETMGMERKDTLKKLFRSMNVDHIEIMTDKDYVVDLVRFFKTRERRLQR